MEAGDEVSRRAQVEDGRQAPTMRHRRAGAGRRGPGVGGRGCRTGGWGGGGNPRRAGSPTASSVEEDSSPDDITPVRRPINTPSYF